MGSPITLSGFNQIDFNQILNAVMQQERIPVALLETEQRALQAQRTAFSTFASKLGALESAAQDLADASSFAGTATTVSDATRLAVSAGGTTPQGTYEIFVDDLARAQVTTAQTTYANTDTAIVADGGTLTIGGVNVSITGSVTLQGLADAINATPNAPAAASIVRDQLGGYQLLLTGRQTGAANTFTIANSLTYSGGAAIAFNGTNAQDAGDAAVRINNVVATSASNTFDGVVPDLSFTVLKQDALTPVTLTITSSSDSVKSLIEKLVSSYNDVATFIDEQTRAAAGGGTNNIGRDALVRGMRRQLSTVLTAAYPSSGTYSSLAELGFSFSRTGELEFNKTEFDAALLNDKTDVQAVFHGASGSAGAFGALLTTIQQYTAAGGLLPDAQTRLDDQVSKVGTRIGELELRLAVRREALQKQFVAADLAIQQLNSSRAQLGSMGGQFSLF